ncbi:Aspartic proteinase Asp1 [Acorus calamus]|uniref:Aspartic proteinase Asp1 n=1 Tax=Acorus calamus TaxID=4465 RepID=A0AAV9FCP5_ACOCL|nr:Aspartic proteinase Asp1 [Acorus calamus]
MASKKTRWWYSMVLLSLLSTLRHSPPFCSAALNNPNPPPPKAVIPQSLASRRSISSAVFPVHGNIYPDGLYYVSLGIGDPPKPYYLDIDTGSDVTWIQCDAPCVSCVKGPHPPYKPKKEKLVPCIDALCQAIHANDDYQCENPNDQCDYEVEYADKGSSLGVLVKDAFSVRFTNGSLLQPKLAFGCGYDQQGFGSPSPWDGVLGLGRGKSGIVTQLRDQGLIRNVIGHCFGSRGGGYLFLGDDLVPSSGVAWAPMSRSQSQKHYSAGQANVYFGKQSLGIRDFSVVFDSGSSYTYFSSRAYRALISRLKKDLPAKVLKEAPEDTTLPVCWKGVRPFKSIHDVKAYFKPLTLSFTSARKALLEIPPERYLILTSHGNVCLGILNGTQAGLKDLNIIGDISMQDLMVIYDNEKNQIGWIPVDCKRLPKSGTVFL